MEQLISLILKVAKEQGYCFPGNKVMIFTVENEGKQNETAAFRMIDIDEEWMGEMTDWAEVWGLKTAFTVLHITCTHILWLSIHSYVKDICSNFVVAWIIAVFEARKLK